MHMGTARDTHTYIYIYIYWVFVLFCAVPSMMLPF